MPAAWETWTLLWLAALQFAVAYWWWRGPHLEGTRGWIAALFALNGTATVLNLGADATGAPLLGILGSFSDDWTNYALLGFALVALDVDDRRQRVRTFVLGGLGVVMAAGSLRWLLSRLSGTPDPRWTTLATHHMLLVAVMATAVALTLRFRTWDGAGDHLWGLALAAVGVRFAELATWLYLPLSLPDMGPDPLTTARGIFEFSAFLAMLAALGYALLRFRRRPPERARRTYELSTLLLLAGFLLGTARSLGSSVSSLGVVFTLAFVRPLGFAEVHSRQAGGHLWTAPRGRSLVTGAGGFAGALLGVGFGATVAIGNAGQHVTGAAFAVVGAWAAAYYLLPDVAERDGRTPSGSTQEPDWPLDPEEAPLPDDWEKQLAEAQQAYQALPSDVRDGLADLAYWERILLALEGAPRDGDLPSYERTTPGLHFRTHCPYSSVGSEISRVNDRWKIVLDEHDVPAPDAPPSDNPLVEGGWGRAEGLDSPRVKHYRLTPLGEEVAAKIRENVGLAEANPRDVARLVPEGFSSP